MADIVDSVTRSRMMAGIRGKNTKPEVALRNGLHRLGLRYRLHCSNLPGKPDLVFPKHRVALFVHGCFWHRHVGCRLASTPAKNFDFWREKFARNVERDQDQIAKLQTAGWRVLIVWECCLRQKQLANLFETISTEIREGSADFKEWPSLTAT